MRPHSALLPLNSPPHHHHPQRHPHPTPQVKAVLRAVPPDVAEGLAAAAEVPAAASVREAEALLDRGAAAVGVRVKKLDKKSERGVCAGGERRGEEGLAAGGGGASRRTSGWTADTCLVSANSPLPVGLLMRWPQRAVLTPPPPLCEPLPLRWCPLETPPLPTTQPLRSSSPFSS